MSKRLSVSLTREDEAIVEVFASPDSIEHDALTGWLRERGEDPGSAETEAGLLRLLVRAGAEALRARVLDASYPQLAVVLGSGDAGEGRAARDRYVDRTERSMPS
ncbi:MAG: hypothetical protein JWM76_1297 [Pseudonocardiales bacterium]|nr:hypothetical protein [Pseudonocardiales bacterium]